jgi:hypothetical protein
MRDENRRVNEDEGISCEKQRVCSPFPAAIYLNGAHHPYSTTTSVYFDQVAQILFAAAHDRFCFLFTTYTFSFADSYSRISVWFSLGQISLSI